MDERHCPQPGSRQAGHEQVPFSAAGCRGILPPHDGRASRNHAAPAAILARRADRRRRQRSDSLCQRDGERPVRTFAGVPDRQAARSAHPGALARASRQAHGGFHAQPEQSRDGRAHRRSVRLARRWQRVLRRVSGWLRSASAASCSSPPRSATPRSGRIVNEELVACPQGSRARQPCQEPLPCDRESRSAPADADDSTAQCRR